MILDTRRHPEELKDDVCSPGGTSIHALHQLEMSGFRASLISAVQAGTERSKEIGKKFQGELDDKRNNAESESDEETEVTEQAETAN